MRIEFDPTNPDEAAAVRAMLTAMHPEPTYVQMFGRGRRVDPKDYEWPAPTEEEVADLVAPTFDPDKANPSLDSTGTPWDARIHSTPPTTNKDGTWRAKRGVKAEEIAQAKAEREALTVETYVELPDDTPSEKVAEAFAEVVSAAPKAPPAPPAPTGQSVSPEPAASTPNVAAPTDGAPSPAPSFLDVMKAITAAQKDGKIDTAKVKELCAAVGAGESTMGLNGPDNGDKRGAFMALLASETEGA